MRKNLYPSELQDRFVLRLPEGMRDEIAAIAKKNHRSMNSELILRLQLSLERAHGEMIKEDKGTYSELEMPIGQDTELFKIINELPAIKKMALLQLLRTNEMLEPRATRKDPPKISAAMKRGTAKRNR